MNILLDPNIAYVMLVFGMLLAILVLFAPGSGFIEIGAGLLLVLAGYSIYNLPINPWALGLLALGVFPFLLAIRLPRWQIKGEPHGFWQKWRDLIFLVAATAALSIGSVLLFTTPGQWSAVNPYLAAFVTIIAVVLMFWVGRRGLEAIRRAPSHDLHSLIGKTGIALTPIHDTGTVYVGSEQWSARCSQPIPAGSHVRVVSREGLTVEVEMVNPDAFHK